LCLDVSRRPKHPFRRVVGSTVVSFFYWCVAYLWWWSGLLLVDLFFFLFLLFSHPLKITVWPSWFLFIYFKFNSYSFYFYFLVLALLYKFYLFSISSFNLNLSNIRFFNFILIFWISNSFFGPFVKVLLVFNSIIQFILMLLCFSIWFSLFLFLIFFLAFLWLLFFSISPFNQKIVFVFYVNFDPYSFEFFLFFN